MTAPYMGGFKILGAGWIGSHALAVLFSSSYGATYAYQIYAGRSLIGFCSPGARTIVGNLKPSDWPQHITILAVTPGNIAIDYGEALPLRPYNKAKFTFSTSSWPADSKFIELTAGTVAGGAVDTTNVLKRISFDVDGDFTIFSPPMPGSGTWNFEIAGRDNKPPDGNRGTALATSAALLVHPPDVVLNEDDSRFTVSVASGTATVSFTNP